MNSDLVAVRKRGEGELGESAIDDMIAGLRKEIASRE